MEAKYILKRFIGKDFETVLETDDPATLYRHKAIYEALHDLEFDRQHPEQHSVTIFHRLTQHRLTKR